MASRDIRDINVGIDVADTGLVVAVRPEGSCWETSNDAAGAQELAARLQDMHPARVVVEATGGPERLIVATLAAFGVPVVVVNPRQVRDFAKASGRLAKTDVVDAGILAWFGEALQPPLRPLASEQSQQLGAALGAPAATGGNADGREESAPARPAGHPGGHSGAYPLAGERAGGYGPAIGRPDCYRPRVGGSGTPLAERARGGVP